MKTSMVTLPAHPVIYEINTRVWLEELSLRCGKTLDLGTVPARQWDRLADIGIDALWLMGVWERSPAGACIAAQNECLVADFKSALPDFSPEDNVGSPYCIRRYAVDAHLGGPEALAEARRALAQRNIGLILDFVPNHVAPDYYWTQENPEYFLQGDTNDLQNDPASFTQIGRRIFARGRDPHFPAWPDVLQLNAFHEGLRKEMIATLMDIARQCDGVRCDMAMLVMNVVFAQTWGLRAGTPPPAEYWPQLIGSIRERHPGFIFMAEAYWNLEWELQQQGFDLCYDKTLYDRLDHGDAQSIRLHLCAERSFQDKLVRFIENHDELRAATQFPAKKEFAAAVTAATIPGARLFHDGQLEGRKIRLPVFLRRRPQESVDPDIKDFYGRLLTIIKSDCFKNGRWKLCEMIRPLEKFHREVMVAWRWSNDTESYLIVVNLYDGEASGQVQPAWEEPMRKQWLNLFDGNVYESNAGMISVDLPAWGFLILKCL